MTWSDIHIDPQRWRADQVLSYIDHQQNVGNVPWSSHSLVSITDVDPSQLDRSDRTVEQADFELDAGDLTTYASTALADAPATTKSTDFIDVGAALALTETTVPASPVYTRAMVELESSDNDAEADGRVAVHGEHGTTASEPVVHSGIDEPETLTTEWERVPQALRSGHVSLQIRSDSDVSTAQVNDATLEVAYRDPIPNGEAVSPRPSGGTEKPLAHMLTIDTTGLQDEVPATVESESYADTSTSLGIRRASPATPVYARVTALLEPVDPDDDDASVRVGFSDPPGRRTESGQSATIDDGSGVRTTGWTAVPNGFNGGTATLQAANATIEVATLELAIRNEI